MGHQTRVSNLSDAAQLCSEHMDLDRLIRVAHPSDATKRDEAQWYVTRRGEMQ